MGYKTAQDLIDELAMGLIPSTAGTLTPSSKLPAVEGSSKSTEVSQPDFLVDSGAVHDDLKNQISVQAPIVEAKDSSDGKIDANPNVQKVTWADQVELEEAQASLKSVEAVEKENQQAMKEATNQISKVAPLPKTFSEVVKNNCLDSDGDLDFISPGSTVEFSKEEWEEGNALWKHAILGAILSFKPSYADVQRWVEVNWKEYKPRISHMKPGVYLFEFNLKEDQIAMLSRNWSFYRKS